MGLGSVEEVPAEESDGVVDGGHGGGKTYGDTVSCSICLEAVADNGDRSWAKLQCGHQFHLDCIGSAFNIKGAMQCPNCRKIEKGRWLYANGCRSFPEFSMEDWNHEEDLYDLSYSEMSFGVHWCPYGSLARLPSSFEEGEFSPSSYHDLLAQHTIFAEPAAVSSGGHPCPYIAYFGPVHPSSSNSNGSISDAPNFNHHWTGATVPSELPGSYAFPAMDLHYHNWDHHSSAFSATNNQSGGADHSAVPSMTQRSVRPSSEIPRSGSFMHPFLVGHSSRARAGSSVTSSMIPPYPGSNARARDRVQALQAYYQHQQPNNNSPLRTPIISATRRTSNFLPHVGAAASSSDQNGGFYFYVPGSSGRNYQEVENPLSARIHAWEIDHLPPMSQLDRDPVWAALHQAGSGSEPGMRGNSLRRHGSEMTSSQNRS